MSDLDVFEWAIRVDEDEPRIIVSLGSDEGDVPFVWFALDADEAQAMGGALVRASGVLMRRDRAVVDPDVFDLEPDDDGAVAVMTSGPNDALSPPHLGHGIGQG